MREQDWERLGQIVARAVEKAIEQRLSTLWLARIATVADAATLGEPISRTRTGPNGTQTLYAVWMGAENPTAADAIWLPVRPGTTLTEGDVVRVERANVGSSSADWWIDGKV